MTLREQLFHEILMARQRVYRVAKPTPLQKIDIPNGPEVWVKREDLSPVYSFKWRGAYNRMTQLTPEEKAKGVVCASAGNHAQGVALAARVLGTHAAIFMPTSTPRMKQEAVKRHGGEAVEIVLTGDSYSDAADAAHERVAETGQTFIHAYDDLLTMAGQGTLADEIVMSGEGPFDVAYLQIGGGGIAAGVACWLKAYYPDIELVGVEGVQQNSMAKAVAAGHPVRLDYVDVFCDGTAVRQAGALTMPICAELIDRFIGVSNEEVCAGIEALWEGLRCIPEPSGAMGLAGALQERENLKGKKVLVLMCGANVDFDQLAWVARHAGIGAERRRYYRFEMAEKSGALLHLLDELLDGINIVEVQYGKVSDNHAWPVIGVEGSPAVLAMLEKTLTEHGVDHEDVTSEPDVEFRVVKYDPEVFSLPLFIVLEFPERAGALREFLLAVGDTASICYFNYTNTGEQVGKALIGFEFKSAALRTEFHRLLDDSPHAYQVMDEDVVHRIM